MRNVHPAVETSWRGLDEILAFHQLSEADFDGKVVADLGCGLSPFAKELKDRGVKAKVISVDGRSDTLRTAVENGLVFNPLHSRLDELEIDDGAVDVAIASYSLPMWGETAKEIYNFYNECERIVCVGGLLSVYPIGIHEMPNYEEPSRHLATQLGARRIRTSSSWEPYKADPQPLPDLLSVVKVS